ncbi:MAG: class I SAM-dependent methyltransferase [Nocardioides sp.]|uniref:class I SAM-dependent methyltransferase n=1 Tax=Nocardioides sp. TaxID=35761 RepID=UPI003F01449D
MTQDLWEGVASPYERSFAHLCAGAVPFVTAQVGAAPRRVLDAGCGSGHLTAALVGAGHRVSALDRDASMVEATRARTGVQAVVADLAEIPEELCGADVVTANFVVNHVPRPREAMGSLASALRVGGRLVATVWSASPPPQALAYGAVMDEAGAVLPDLPRLDPADDFERTPAGLARIAQDAGLQVVHASAPRWTWRVDGEDLWAGLTSIGNFGVRWRAQDDAVRARAAALWHERHSGEQAFEVECLLVVAESYTPGRGGAA